MNCSKALKLFVVALLMGTVLQAQSGRTLSLREAVETGVKNNFDVNRRYLAMERAGVGLSQSRGDMLPSLGANINHNLNAGRNIDYTNNAYINQQYTNASYSLNADFTIFNGFRLWNRLRASQFAYEAGKMEWQLAKDDLTLQIILSYLQILTNEDQLALAKVQTAQFQQQVDRLQILNNQGAILPSDLFDVQVNLSDSKINEINSKNALETAKLNLAQQLNLPYDSTLQVERLPIESFDMNYAATPDSIYAIAKEQLAMAKAPILRRQSAEKYLAAARGNLVPSVGFGAGFATQFSSTGRDGSGNKIGYYDQLKNNYGSGFGIGVNIPILNNFLFRNNVKLAKIDLKENELAEQNAQIRLKQIIERDYFNMQNSIARYKALVEQVTAVTLSFQAAEARFNAGVGNSFDFLTARNNLNRANVNLIVARYDYALRTKILDFYQGRPLF